MSDEEPRLLRFIPRDRQVTCWGIGDGAAGHRSQILGLCHALGGTHELFESRVRLPWKCFPVGWIPTWRSVLRQDVPFPVSPQPRAITSCGHSGAISSILVRRTFSIPPFAIHLQNPGCDLFRFDLVVAPEHDLLNGPNVIPTFGALHPLSPGILARLASEPAPPGLRDVLRPFAAVLLGGPNKYYPFSPADMAAFARRLNMVSSLGIALAIIPSRRTPAHAVQTLQWEFGDRYFVWDGKTENPYRHALAQAEHVIVTSDSVSMISEAAATGRPVHVEFLTARRRPVKFERFHASFLARELIRPFTGGLPEWSYPPLFEADRVARLVQERWWDGPRRQVS